MVLLLVLGLADCGCGCFHLLLLLLMFCSPPSFERRGGTHGGAGRLEGTGSCVDRNSVKDLVVVAVFLIF